MNYGSYFYIFFRFFTPNQWFFANCGIFLRLFAAIIPLVSWNRNLYIFSHFTSSLSITPRLVLKRLFISILILYSALNITTAITIKIEVMIKPNGLKSLQYFNTLNKKSRLTSLWFYIEIAIMSYTL